MNQVTQNICLQNNDKTYTVSGHLVSVVLILAAVVAGSFCCAKKVTLFSYYNTEWFLFLLHRE